MTRFRLGRSMLFVVWMQLLLHSVHSKEHSKCPLQVPSTIENRPSKTIIAHRGASFSLPEHTLEAYRLALDLGADYIEPDLVSTKDGKLIALHTMDLNITTNVADVYPGRTSFSEFANRTGYWAHEFDLKEIQQLKVKQRLSETGARSTAYDGLFSIPTLPDILELLQEYNKVIPLLTTIKKRVGLYAELKYPEWLEQDANMSMVDLFLDELSESLPKNSPVWNDTECASLKFNEYLVPPLVLQSFDGLVLKQLYNKWPHKTPGTVPPPMVLLVDLKHCWLDDFWFHVGEWSIFLDGIGPDKWCLVGDESRPFVNRAREHELAIHPWTVRGEREFQLKNSTSVSAELEHWFCDLNVDGIFVENVDVAVRVASTPCPNDEEQEPPTLSPATSNKQQQEQQQQSCSNNETELYVGLVAGFLGIFVGSIFSCWCSNRKQRQHSSQHQMAIPTQEQHDGTTSTDAHVV